MLIDYREALLNENRIRFAALEEKTPRPGPELLAGNSASCLGAHRRITRAEVAALVDDLLDPFNLKPVDHRGRFAR